MLLANCFSGFFWTKWWHNRQLRSISVEFNEETNEFVLKPQLKNKFYSAEYYNFLCTWKVMSLVDQYKFWYSIFFEAWKRGNHYVQMWDSHYCLYNREAFKNMYNEWKKDPRTWIYIPDSTLECTSAVPKIPPLSENARNSRLSKAKVPVHIVQYLDDPAVVRSREPLILS